MANISILEATINDLELLQKIGRQTFSETFAASNSLENMTKYLAEGFSSEKLLGELTNINAAFYIAKNEMEVVGYLKLNFGQSQTELRIVKHLKLKGYMYYRNFRVKILDNYFMRKPYK
jgi:hypothetical protein